MTYLIRYVPRAQALKDGLPSAQRASLEGTEKSVRQNPYGPATDDNHDGTRSAYFEGGFIVYVISGDKIEVRVIDLVAP